MLRGEFSSLSAASDVFWRRIPLEEGQGVSLRKEVIVHSLSFYIKKYSLDEGMNLRTCFVGFLCAITVMIEASKKGTV